MKKIFKLFLIFSMFLMVFVLFTQNNVQAASKKKSNKVTYTLKKGTLTIKGKGKMPKSMTFKNNKKIKKVVIKKGVTSISKRAFYKCKNLKSVKIANTVKVINKEAFYSTGLKKITIPKSVKKIGAKALYSGKLKKITMPGKMGVNGYLDMLSDEFMLHVDTVKFTTSLDLDLVDYCFADNFVVSKKDKKYKSIDGVIYTKNGKKVVRVPDREKVQIAEGCTEFKMESILYSIYIGDDMYISHCTVLKELILPKSLKKITSSELTNEIKDYQQFIERYRLEKVIVKNKELKEDSINIFTNIFSNYFDSELIQSENADNLIKFTKKVTPLVQ